MTEIEQAKKIANDWLDGKMNPPTQMVPGDPDCDACVLARQYNRSLELPMQLLSTLLWLRNHYDVGKPELKGEVLKRIDVVLDSAVSLGYTMKAKAPTGRGLG